MTVSTDPAATLHALANYLAGWGDEIGGTDDRYAERDETTLRALAEHVEGVTQRHEPEPRPDYGPEDEPYYCGRCGGDWPCDDYLSLLAVAAAAGITPEG